MYTALNVAKYIINKCMIENYAVSNMQLQKILYYAQREFLWRGEPLFSEDIEAWQIGPVVPQVYERYCGFGGMPIRVEYTVSLGKNDATIVDSVVREKRSLPSWAMADDIQAPNKAWSLVWRDGLGDHWVIPRELIKCQG